MSLKKILTYKLFSNFSKKYNRFFNSLYKHKLNDLLTNMIRKNVKIDTIYDIGAYKGKWSKFLNETSLKKKNFYLFEANEEHEPSLRKLKFKYYIGVLSDKKKEVNFFSKAHLGDSYFFEQTNFYEKDIKPKVKITNTLDEIIGEKNFPLPDFIKIDTQGSELDILKGGKKTTNNCSLIYLECPIIEYNLGSPNLSQYIQYLESIDFIPYDICETHYIDKVLVQIDILFIKKSIIKKIHPVGTMLNILN